MRKLLNDITTLLKSNFLAGAFIIIPLAVAAWLLFSAMEALWHLQFLVPEQWRPESFIQDRTLITVLNLIFIVVATLALAMGISFLGWSSKHYLGRKTLQWVAEVIQHIPVVRSVYSALDQLLRTLGSGGGQQFNRVVYVEYPRKGLWTLAFVTGPAKSPAIGSAALLNIYVPTTPNPTSGFHLIVPETDVRDANMKVEDAFKTILSLGIAQPEFGAPTPQKQV
ncbi:MAG: DUF502 domain-containing protein [Oligoflexia bacterium]|nr:DUF502 domain-containing protein [Oligoflexia bacterium]